MDVASTGFSDVESERRRDCSMCDFSERVYSPVCIRLCVSESLQGWRAADIEIGRIGACGRNDRFFLPETNGSQCGNGVGGI